MSSETIGRKSKRRWLKGVLRAGQLLASKAGSGRIINLTMLSTGRDCSFFHETPSGEIIHRSYRRRTERRSTAESDIASTVQESSRTCQTARIRQGMDADRASASLVAIVVLRITIQMAPSYSGPEHNTAKRPTVTQRSFRPLPGLGPALNRRGAWRPVQDVGWLGECRNSKIGKCCTSQNELWAQASSHNHVGRRDDGAFAAPVSTCKRHAGSV